MMICSYHQILFGL